MSGQHWNQVFFYASTLQRAPQCRVRVMGSFHTCLIWNKAPDAAHSEDYRWCHVKVAGRGIRVRPPSPTLLLSQQRWRRQHSLEKWAGSSLLESVCSWCLNPNSAAELCYRTSADKAGKKRAEPRKADFQYPTGCMIPHQEKKTAYQGKNTCKQLFQYTKWHWHSLKYRFRAGSEAGISKYTSTCTDWKPGKWFSDALECWQTVKTEFYSDHILYVLIYFKSFTSSWGIQ